MSAVTCAHGEREEMLTGNGLAYMDDKDEERFGQALRLRASPVDKQNRRVSSLCGVRGTVVKPRILLGVSSLSVTLDEDGTTRLQDADLCWYPQM